VKSRAMGQVTERTPMLNSITPRILAAALAFAGVLGLTSEVQAEELQLSGPLAGAPAVRNMRLYRKGRLELSPSVSFSILDEYRHQILFGLRANYGIFDWLSLGVWGGLSTSMIGLDIDTHLTGQIQSEGVAPRQCRPNEPMQGQPNFVDCELTAVNLSQDFRKQVANINWVAAPQLQAVPFRGKLGLFNSIFVDAELYLFAGPAFVGLKQRAECAVGTCGNTVGAQNLFPMTESMAIAPTFGLGFSFFFNKWMAVGAEYRALPFSWNTAGFDIAGRGPGLRFPDGAISGADSEFKFNNFLSVSFNMYLPTNYQVTE
jgi:opacity protein-like surface antigen